MRSRLFPLVLLFLLASDVSLPAFPEQPRVPPAAGRTIDYARDIQPLLASRCYRCHGEAKQKSGLRLDLKADALKGGELGRDVIPGRGSESRLIQYIAGLDRAHIMPPSGPRLSAEEIGLLRAWIDQGATWPESTREKGTWWSLAPLTRPAIPALAPADAAWARNPVDHFILARLRQKGLTPSPEADRRTLFRRLSFDLLGLPPTPEEIDAFVADPDSLAYEKLVDRLLASPRYGERWARHWLDVVHFGETHGYDKDKPRPNAWPYRDYVIRAFNEDKPYARFVEEQLAGDVLYPGTADGIEALGFIAAGPWDFIGHAEVPESKIDGKVARHLDRDDMVSNTINTFASLTVQCAQCHNHKFDPITQEDYYSLQAVFAALDRADRPYDPDPSIARRRLVLTTRLQELQHRMQEIDAGLRQRGGAEFAAVEQALQAADKRTGTSPRPEFGYHSAIEPTQDRVKWVQVDLGKRCSIDRLVYYPCHDDFNHIGDGFGFPVRYKIELADDPEFAKGVQLLEDRTGADVPNPGIAPQRLALAGRTGRYVRFTATRLALRQNDFIFALAELSVFDAAGRNMALGAEVSALDSIEGPPRWSRRNLVDGVAPGLDPSRQEQIAKLRERRRSLVERLLDPAARQEWEDLSTHLEQVRQELARLPAPRQVYAGTVYTGSGAFTGTGANGGRPRPIHVLNRGDVNKPGRLVGPGALSAVRDLPARFDISPERPEAERRAALAHWLTDRRNPLTWRSIVNRVWLYHFGRGLVDSPNDFGRMGQLPTHPELLDWLAVEFRDGGQSLKSLHRLLVTSATYRQASTSNLRAEAVDASNTLYGRMNRRRLEAEEVRDGILSVSGQLDLGMFGPSFQDFVIDKPEHSPHYEYELSDPEDPRSHRRSVYRFLVRSRQQPFMAALDCADPSMLVDKRNQTITPLQALALLNDRLTVTMARHFAERVRRLEEEPGRQIQLAFRLATAREPTPREARELTEYARKYGLANACRVILNLNEFVFVD